MALSFQPPREAWDLSSLLELQGGTLMLRERESPAKVTLLARVRAGVQVMLPPAFSRAPAGHVPPGAVGVLGSAPGPGPRGFRERDPRAPAGPGGGSPAPSGWGGRAREQEETAGRSTGAGLLRHASADDDSRGRGSDSYGFLRGFPSWAVPGRDSGPGHRGWAGGECADAGRCPPRYRAAIGQAGRREGKGALEQMDDWAALRRDSLGVGPWNVLPPEAGTTAREYSQFAFDWKFMQEKPGCETDCLHLFLKEPSSGRVNIFAKRPS